MNKTLSASLLATTLMITLDSHAAIISGWGAATSNSTNSSCPSFCNGSSQYASDGGEGFTSAQSDIDNSSGIANSFVELSGTSYTPVLKAYSEAYDGRGAFSLAVGVQGYSYSGPATTIELDLAIDAFTGLTAGSTSTNPEADFEAQIVVLFASQVDFYSHYGTFAFEVAPDAGDVVIAQQFFGTTNTTISFDVEDGDDFFIWAGIDADAERGGLVDAYNTFTMSFQDDTGLSAAVVPVPAAVWLFTSGLLMLMGIGRRHR